MSLFQMLLKTYENNSRMIGIQQDEAMPAPIAHMPVNAQLEVTVDQEGRFVAASTRSRSLGQVMIPVTESSAGRSSGVTPHALCDMLPYVAGDFSQFVENKKDRTKAEDKYETYIEALQKWVESEYSTKKLHAIYSYLKKKSLIQDLICSGIIKISKAGFYEKKKIEGSDYEKTLVIFRVSCQDDLMDDAVWNDVELQRKYTAYYLSSLSGTVDVCYISGNKDHVTKNHPKGIIASNYGAKLLSANDNQGFTFRGRFMEAEEAVAVSYVASQKVHSTLSWLVKKQGLLIGKEDKRTYLIWNPRGEAIDDFYDLFDFSEKTDDDLTDASLKDKLKRFVFTGRNRFHEDDDIIMLTLDAATTGRLSITYYSEFKAHDFFSRVQKWYEDSQWYFVSFISGGKRQDIVSAPRLKQIIKCAYGTVRDGYLDVNDKILKTQMQNLMHSVLFGKPVSYSLIKTLLHRASEPQKYGKWYLYEEVLSTACAMCVKYFLDKGDERFMGLELNKNSDDRSYNLGRLLAVLDQVERCTYKRDEDRMSNAIRLQSVYVNRPWTTYMNIEGRLIPYYKALRPGSREYYRNLISEIIQLLPTDETTELNRPLEASYLLGFYLQRSEFHKSTENKKEEE